MFRKNSSTQKVRVKGKQFVKYFNKDVEVEYRKHNAVYEITNKNGADSTIAIDFNVEEKSICYGYFPGLKSIREHFLEYTKKRCILGRTHMKIEALFYQLGEILAHLHLELTLNREKKWVPPKEFSSLFFHKYLDSAENILDQTPQAVIHGDFGFSNICWVDSNPYVLVIIDPSPNFYTSFYCNERSSIYLDLAKFTLCLKGLFPIKHYFFRDWRRSKELENKFIEGYEKMSGYTIDPKLLSTVESAVLLSKIRHEHSNIVIRIISYVLIYGIKKGAKLGGIDHGI